MQIDTGEFRALTEQAGQVAALGRKISTLTGRLTVMGNRLNRLDDLVEDQVAPLTRLAAYMLPPREPRESREPGRHAAPKPKRHLRLVERDGRQ